MDYNYHTHTYRCSHASGTEEEYIKRAIECGVKYMGFSEHIPFIFPDGHESGYRLPVSETQDYFCTLYNLREKYKNQIDIKIGFEMEYYPEYFEQMLQNSVLVGCEYLILGQHFLYNEYPAGKYVGTPTEAEDDLQDYTDCVISGIESGVFTYVAHPDVLNFCGNMKLYDKNMREICRAAKEYNVPLEINFLGMRDNRNYPNEEFWKIAGEEKTPVTFGFDAHDAQTTFDEDSLLKAKDMVKRYNLNYTGKPELINIPFV